MVEARTFAAFLLYAAGYDFNQIGKLLNRDRTTINYLIKRIEKLKIWAKNDKELFNKFNYFKICL